jgi:predicted restriction endonuclease
VGDHRWTDREGAASAGEHDPQIVTNTETARRPKELHDHECQICGIRLETPAGRYAEAEAAHIRPVGTPDNGPDTADNISLLCSNHHALFDLGGFTINSDLKLLGSMAIFGRLRSIESTPAISPTIGSTTGPR